MRLTAVVNGHDTTITAAATESVGSVADRARAATAYGGGPGEWEVRDARGTLLDEATSVDAAGLIDGDLLYVTLRAGWQG